MWRIIARLLSRAWPYRPFLAISLASALLATGLNLAFPLLIKIVIDEGLIGADRGYLALAAVLAIVLAVFRSVFLYCQQYFAQYTAVGVRFDLRNEFYQRVQRQSFSFHDTTPSGHLINQFISDTEAIGRFLGQGMMHVVVAGLMLVGTSVILLFSHWKLALLSMIIFPLIALTTYQFQVVARPLFMRARDQLSRVNTVILENLTGIKVVKAFARESHEIEKLRAADRHYVDLNLRAIHVWAYTFPLLLFLSTAGTAVVLWYGGREVVAGNLSIGSLVAFTSYLVLITPALRRLGLVINALVGALTSGQRLFEFFDTPNVIESRPEAIKPENFRGHVRFDNVSFRYDPKIRDHVLQDIDIDAKPGQVVALIGHTGGGKSTIAGLIPRFYDVTSGRVTIDGHDVRDLDLKSLRSHIGIVQQESFLFSATIAENIAYGRPGATEEQIVEVARLAQADEFIGSFPAGYQAKVGERGTTVSGGQRQRIAIARALLKDPKILILDDATSSVDTETEYLIQKALVRLMKGRTTIVIAQRLLTVKSADEILVVENGRIVERGTHQELLVEDGYYASIYRSQLKDQEEMSQRVEAALAAHPVT